MPTAILSRQVGVVRGGALILNLPGQPKAIKETLDGVFPAVPYCIDLIGGPYIETHEAVCKAFRPKSAHARSARVIGAAERRRNVGVACVVASAVAFGAMAILARFAFASGVDTVTLLALRFAIGSSLMLAHAARARQRDTARVDARRAGRARRAGLRRPGDHLFHRALARAGRVSPRSCSTCIPRSSRCSRRCFCTNA